MPVPTSRLVDTRPAGFVLTPEVTPSPRANARDGKVLGSGLTVTPLMPSTATMQAPLARATVVAAAKAGTPAPRPQVPTAQVAAIQRVSTETAEEDEAGQAHIMQEVRKSNEQAARERRQRRRGQVKHS